MNQPIAKSLIPVTTYHEPVEFATKQLEVFWLPDEINVEKDIQDVLVNFTKSEKHAVIATLKLFSIYETHAGDEYWGKRYKEIFKGFEFHRMASTFSMIELAVHAPFYNKINELLHLDDEEFFLSYLDNPVLTERVKHIGQMINHDCDPVSVATFSLVEGAILYSAFGFLKHYQSQGKNKLMNVVRGINFSVRDENLHAMAGAWSFRLLMEREKQEFIDMGCEESSFEEYAGLVKEEIFNTAQKIFEHEKQIIAMLFTEGKIDGITPYQLECFVQSRINLCLENLGYEKLYEVKYDPISLWFYKGINDFQFNDFFSGQGREYSRDWNEDGFVWRNE